MGLFTGSPPRKIGVIDGRLHPVREDRWNAVSSQSGSSYHKIEPLAGGRDPAATFERLCTLVGEYPGARIIVREPGYLYAQFTSGVFGFVDDAEFLLDLKAAVIQVRSASRLGRKDFGVNRYRIERLRGQLVASP